MKFSLFVIYFSYVAARYHFLTVPEDKPVMYFDGTEWRSMKPNRNFTTVTRRPNLSALLDIFLTPSNITAVTDNYTDLDSSSMQQALIARVFDEDIQQNVLFKTTPETENYTDIDSSTLHKALIARVFDEDIQQKILFKTTPEDRTKEPNHLKVTTEKTTDKSDYSVILSHMLKDTAKLQKNSKEVSRNANLTTDPAEWIKLMMELSLTLKEIAEKQNVSYYTQIQKSDVTSTMSPTTMPTSSTLANITIIPTSDFTSFDSSTTKKRKIRPSKKRRTMDGIDDIVAILTGGIEIDNGSETSDELNMANKKYLRKHFSPNAQVKEMRNGNINKENYDIDQNRDTDSGDMVSDGVEETRFVLVEDKSDNNNVKLRNS